MERLIVISEPVEIIPSLMVDVRSVGVGYLKGTPCVDLEGVAVHHQPRGSKILPGFSDVPVPRNISCPISPVGIESPLYHSQSPKHMSGRLSFPTISSPRAVSGLSTPLSGGGGVVPIFNPMTPTTYSSEGVGTSPRAQSCFYPDGYTRFFEIQQAASEVYYPTINLIKVDSVHRRVVVHPFSEGQKL